jgi:hypothetical protein
MICELGPSKGHSRNILFRIPILTLIVLSLMGSVSINGGLFGNLLDQGNTLYLFLISNFRVPLSIHGCCDATR